MVVDMRVMPQTVLLQTAHKLREAIMAGHFAPGERLIEAALCEQMGVSRTTIREAIRRLESEKLITTVPNKGPSIATITLEDAEQIYHVRRLLEGEAAALFAQRATDQEIVELRAALARFEAAVKNDEAITRIAATGQFYDVILHGCGNRIIRELLEGLLARINLLRAKSMSNPGRSKSSLTEMRKILTAIVQRDPDSARKAAEAHVDAARAAVYPALSGNLAPQKSVRRASPRKATAAALT
jgi:DNA-binding GntR family transcriptional regulator